MRRITVLAGAGLAAGIVLAVSLAAAPSRHGPLPDKSWIAAAYGRLPLALEPSDPDVAREYPFSARTRRLDRPALVERGGFPERR